MLQGKIKGRGTLVPVAVVRDVRHPDIRDPVYRQIGGPERGQTIIGLKVSGNRLGNVSRRNRAGCGRLGVFYQ
jgi:hypothetical protein